MDCRELSSQIEDYCDDSVSPQTYLKISKHLKECPTCQQLYQLTRLENEVLRDTSDIPPLSPISLPGLWSRSARCAGDRGYSTTANFGTVALPQRQ